VYRDAGIDGDPLASRLQVGGVEKRIGLARGGIDGMAIAHRWRFWVAMIPPGLVVLTAVDALLGVAYRTDTNADVRIIGSRSGTTHRGIVVFPGYIMPGSILGQAFAPHINADDALVVVDYAQRGMNIEQICGKVMAALHTLRPAELQVYGASMGGMLGKLFLDRYRQAGAPYGKATFVLDTAPSSPSNVRRPGFLFDVSCWYRGGPLSSVVWASVAGLGTKPPTEPDVPQDILRAARHAGAWVGMPAATSQACFIATFDPLRSGELLDVAKRVVYLEGSSPGEDPLIRIPDAIAGWRVAFPGLTVMTVKGRSQRWHLPLMEYPRATVRAMIDAGS
jgi:hypothetical protein